MKFEEKMDKLEKIICELENNDIDLDSAINKYSEAMKLIKDCSEQLNDIEKKVTKMITDDGKIQDFEIEL